MDKEYVMHIAQTIKEQLLSFTPIPVSYTHLTLPTIA